MEILLWTLLALQTTAILVPVETGSMRCLAIYSSQQEDTIKVSMQFPRDAVLEMHYDYVALIRDLSGRVIHQRTVQSRIFRTEVSIPNSTFLPIQTPSTKPASESSPTPRAPHRKQPATMAKFSSTTRPTATL
jgi:hypothetical protein